MSFSPQAPKEGGTTFVVIAALVGNGAVAVVKFIAAAITGSSAMLSEAVHSVADTGNQALLLYGGHRAQAPPDRQHPLGHGRELYFWGFVVANLLFSMGAGVAVYEGIQKIIDPHPLKSIAVSYAVLAAAFLFESASAYFGYRELNKRRGSRSILQAIRASKDPALFTVVVEDTAALLGLFIAAAGITLAHFTDLLVADGIASIIIGLMLAIAAALLAYETKSLLIGEAAGDRIQCKLQRTIRSKAENSKLVEDVNDIRALQLGVHQVLVIVSIDFVDEATSKQIETFTEELEARVRATVPDVSWLLLDTRSSRSKFGMG